MCHPLLETEERSPELLRGRGQLEEIVGDVYERREGGLGGKRGLLMARGRRKVRRIGEGDTNPGREGVMDTVGKDLADMIVKRGRGRGGERLIGTVMRNIRDRGVIQTVTDIEKAVEAHLTIHTTASLNTVCDGQVMTDTLAQSWMKITVIAKKGREGRRGGGGEGKRETQDTGIRGSIAGGGSVRALSHTA